MNKPKQNDILEIHSDKIDKNILLRAIEKNLQKPKVTKRKKIAKKSPSENKTVYSMEDFTKYHDEQFIKEIYRKILHREVDAPALQHYLSLLRSGQRTKGDILALIRFSAEGRKNNVTILGIKKRYIMFALKRLPKIGYFFNILFSIATLPKIVQRLNVLEANYFLHTSQNQKSEEALNSFYLAFEDKFRGTREAIKQRQTYYLPIIEKIIQKKSETILDVGCGRGEWLELLQENGYRAKGVDLNETMVKKAQEYGLDATAMDAIHYLQSLSAQSLSVVSGFHIVEHLPFEVLVALFDESLRVLKPGGIIIFETPNPENLLVGSCTFYTDPTHKNPIPPATLEFLAKNRGFSHVEVHRLHKLKEPVFLQGKNTHDVNDLIFAASKEQDYAIIGYKA